MLSLNKSSNPVFSEGNLKDVDFGKVDQERMTLQGTINKSFISLALLMASAIFVWSEGVAEKSTIIYMVLGFIVSLIVSLITIFNKKLSHITVPIYSIFEGMLLGGLSATLELRFPGIPTKAVMLTMGTFLVMLFCYKNRIIRATEKFKSVIIAATGGIMLVYLMGLIMSFFGVELFIYGNSNFSIGFSVVVVVLAALSLILDFNNIEENTRSGAPKYMEWYCAFGLMVTLVWLYLEFLRLLTKLQSRD